MTSDAPLAVAGLLARLSEDVLAAARRCHAGDGDGDAIHDLRVAARRMEVALGLWRSLLPPRARARALRALRRCRRKLTTVRELEVQSALLTDPEWAAAPHDVLHVVAIRERLTRRRDRERARIARWFSDTRLAKLERRLAAASREATGTVPTAGPLLDAAERLLRREQRSREALAMAWDSDDDETLHRARIAVKKRRYAEEALAPVAGTPLSDAVASARAQQRALGAVHDSAELRDCLHRHADRALSRRHPERAAALTAAAERVEQRRHEVLAQFRSLRAGAPGTAAGD